jgi:hypothetical protein
MSDTGTMQNETTHHEPNPSIAAYALGILDTEERAELEAHLVGCAVCQAELIRLETVVGDLGNVVAPVPPRPALRENLLAEISADRAAPAALPLWRRQIPAIWLGIAASIAILSLVVLGAMLLRVQDERDEAMYAQQAVADYLKEGGTLSQLVPPPDAPEGAAPGHGSLIVAPDQSGAMLVVYDLPPTTKDRTYMAWAERDGERTRLGELHVNDEGVGWLYLYGPEPMSTYETIGMTLFSPAAPEGETFLVATVE